MEKKVEKQTNSALLTAGLLDFYFFLLLPLLDSPIFAAVWEETFTINGVTICLGGMPRPGEDRGWVAKASSAAVPLEKCSLCSVLSFGPLSCLPS